MKKGMNEKRQCPENKRIGSKQYVNGNNKKEKRKRDCKEGCYCPNVSGVESWFMWSFFLVKDPSGQTGAINSSLSSRGSKRGPMGWPVDDDDA